MDANPRRLRAMPSDNVDVIEAAWAAFGKGDLDGATGVAAPEAEIRAPESLPWGGTYIGPEGFRELLGKLLGNFEQFKATPEKVLGADDDHVVVVARINARANGGQIEQRAVWVYKMRDGQVVDAEAQTDTARILDALG
jgi:uncharacterized protein